MPTRIPQPYTCRTHHLVPTRRALSPDRSGACPPPLHHAPQHGVSANSNSATRLACGSFVACATAPVRSPRLARPWRPRVGCIVSLPEPQIGSGKVVSGFVARDHGRSSAQPQYWPRGLGRWCGVSSRGNAHVLQDGRSVDARRRRRQPLEACTEARAVNRARGGVSHMGPPCIPLGVLRLPWGNGNSLAQCTTQNEWGGGGVSFLQRRVGKLRHAGLACARAPDRHSAARARHWLQPRAVFETTLHDGAQSFHRSPPFVDSCVFGGGLGLDKASRCKCRRSGLQWSAMQARPGRFCTFLHTSLPVHVLDVVSSRGQLGSDTRGSHR
jgi:hypothetical protein